MQDTCWICGSNVLPEDTFCRKCGTRLTRPESIASIPIWQSRRRVSLGIFLIVLGSLVGGVSYFMGIIPMLAFGLACFLIGLMIIYLPESTKSVSNKLATDVSLPSILNVERLLEDLDLDERGIYVPVSGLGVSPKVFVPLVQTKATARPPIGLSNSNRIFVTVGSNPEDRGILLDAPGSQIMSTLETALGHDLADVSPEDLEAQLDSAMRRLDIAKTVVITRQDSDVNVDIRLIALVDLEEKLRNLAPRVVAQVGTPLASSVASALSKSTRGYVRFRGAVLHLPEKRLNISLRVVE